MEEELSSKDDIENAPNLSATSDTTTIPATSNSNQSPVSSNPSIAGRTAMKETENDGTKYVFIRFDCEERGRRATHNELTEQSSLPRRNRLMSDSPSDVFQLLLDGHAIFFI